MRKHRKPLPDLKARMAEQRERMRRARELQLLRLKLGQPTRLRDADEVAPEAKGVAALNAEVDALGKKRKRNKLSGDELEKWRRNRERVREIRERQADAGYYAVVCFDTSGQCQAWIDFLLKEKLIPPGGDLFLDGRILAERMGCKVPPPEYEMTTSVTLARGETKTMPKIPKGGR